MSLSDFSRVSASDAADRQPADEDSASIKTLVVNGDVQGLVQRLRALEFVDPPQPGRPPAPGVQGLLRELESRAGGPAGRQRADIILGLQSLGERAVPTLIDELGDADDEVDSAIELALVGIGAPSLPALVEVIRCGPKHRLLSAATVIGEMRQQGVPLPAAAVADLLSIQRGDRTTVARPEPWEIQAERQMAAAHALGPLDGQDLAPEVGIGPTNAGADPVTDSQHCKRCGRTMNTSKPPYFTCNSCGATRWGPILSVAALALICVAVVIRRHDLADSWWRPFVVGAAGVLGSVLLIDTFIWSVSALRTHGKKASGSGSSGAVTSTGGSEATPSPGGEVRAVRVTIRISGAIEGSAEYLGSYEMSLPLDLPGSRLLNTIAGRIIRPTGPVLYYNGYQLYAGTALLTCRDVPERTLRNLGVTDGDVLDFLDLGGSFI